MVIRRGRFGYALSYLPPAVVTTPRELQLQDFVVAAITQRARSQQHTYILQSSQNERFGATTFTFAAAQNGKQLCVFSSDKINSVVSKLLPSFCSERPTNCTRSGERADMEASHEHWNDTATGRFCKVPTQ